MTQFTSVHDVPDPDELIREALILKQNPLAFNHIGKNKTLGLLFMNPSLRTRVSTQIAAQNLGMQVITMNADKDNWALEFSDGAGGTHPRRSAGARNVFRHLGRPLFPGTAIA